MANNAGVIQRQTALTVIGISEIIVAGYQFPARLKSIGESLRLPLGLLRF